MAQASAGGNTGADCANARAVSSLGSGDWGSDKNVHLCGNITSTITISTAGTSGHPTSLIFETGASMSQASWGNVNVITANKDWEVIDGGTNGFIANTNVSSTANSSVDTGGVAGQPTNNSIVKNLGVFNLFVKTTNDNVGHGDAIHLWGSNNRITNCIVHDVLLGPTIDYLGTQTGGEIDHNVIHNVNQGMISADRSSVSTSSGMKIHDNEVYDWQNWDNPLNNAFHHNGVFIEVNNDTASVSGLQVYNNYFHGDTGVFMTGEIFLDAEGNGTNGSYNGALLFNNLMVDSSTVNVPSNGLIITKANGGSPAVGIYNNTQVYPSSNKGRCNMNQGAVWTLKNNIAAQCSLFVFLSSGTAPTSDYNDLFQNTGTNTTEGTHTITADPLLNGTYFLTTGSPAISAALNLTSLGNTNLDLDKALVSRPPSLPWDMGVYQFASSFLPAPPFPCNACMASLKNPFGGTR